MASREDLVAAIARAYGVGAALGHLPCAAPEAPVPIPAPRPANEALVEAAAPDLLGMALDMMQRARRHGTLSVHVEAMPAGLPGALRFRVEGTVDP